MDDPEAEAVSVARKIKMTADETNLISATALVLAGISYSILTSNFDHQLPKYDITSGTVTQSNCSGASTAGKGCETYRNLKLVYVAIASSGVMLLFCTAMMAHSLCVACKSRNSSRELLSFARRWCRCCKLAGFIGMFLSLAAEAIVLFLDHSDSLQMVFCFIAPNSLIFVLTLFCIIPKLERGN